MAQTTVAINLEAKTSGTESVKSLKAQIREATQEAVALAQKFGEFSPEAIKAAQRVANLKDQMEDFQQKVQALNPDKFNQINTIAKGVANGFQAAQGAMALFGAESEDVQKALLKVQGAMALAQGLEGLGEAGKQLKALGERGIEAFQKMTTASKAFMVTGIGLLVTALGTVAAYWDEIAVSIGLAKSEMDKANDAMNQAAAETKIQAQELGYYNSVVQDTNKSEGEREFALQKLKEAGIATDDVNIANANSLAELNARTQQHIKLIAQRARAEAIGQIIQEKTKKLIEQQNGAIDDSLGFIDKLVVGATSNLMGFSEGAETATKRATNNMKEQQAEIDKLVKLQQTELEKTTALQGKNLETQKKVQSSLKKNNQKTTVDLVQQGLERQAALLALDQSTLEKQIAAADAAFAVRVKGLKQQGFTELQINAMRDVELEKVRTAFYDKQKAEQEKFAAERKSLTDKEIADTVKATDDFYKTQQIALAGNNEALAQLEVQRLEAQLQNARDYGQSTVDLELQLAQKKKEISDKQIEDEKKKEEAIQSIRMSGLQGASDALNALSGLMKEGSNAQKAFAIAAIAADTAKAISSTIVEARNTARNMTAMGVPAPGPQIAGAAVYASGLAMVLTNAKKARDILKGGGSASAGGGGGMGAAGAAPAPAVPMAGGALPEEGQFGGMGRVYVLEGDITKTQTRVRRLRNTSVV